MDLHPYDIVCHDTTRHGNMLYVVFLIENLFTLFMH
jgi:hypothetical protein